MSKLAAREWADDDEEDAAQQALPAQQITTNKDGTKTVITYSLNEAGKKVKTTRRIRTITKREMVNPHVAERRAWTKFGQEKGHAPGPNLDTTTVGENIMFRPSVTWKKDGQDEVKKAEEEKAQDAMRSKKVLCRICQGEHFTARCPFKESMAPAGENPDADDAADVPSREGALGGGGSGGYVPPHLRKGATGAGDKMGGGKFERDDLATLRVTNVSEFAEEQDLRDIFERYGRVTRVFLAKDRDTGRAKGFAFISYADRMDAQRACDKLDGFGYENLILRVEFAKKPT